MKTKNWNILFVITVISWVAIIGSIVYYLYL